MDGTVGDEDMMMRYDKTKFEGQSTNNTLSEEI